MKILVVDDSAVMRKITIKALREAGHSEIMEAENGQDALDKAPQVDIVFTDWNMPVMDGITFFREFRKDHSTPIVMVTTEGGQKQVLEAMKAGVNDYIVKPFEASTIIEKLKLVTGT